MIEAIWPSFATWNLDTLPTSAAITSPDLLTFALFWLATIPFLFLSIPALRWMFIIKIALMPFFYMALMTWALTAANGVGPLFAIPNNITNGWSVGYAFCYTITATISGNASELGSNSSDSNRKCGSKSNWPSNFCSKTILRTTIKD